MVCSSNPKSFTEQLEQMTQTNQTNRPKPIWKQVAWPVVIIIAGILIFSGYLDNGWIYDDDYLIVDNEWYRTPFEFSDLAQDLGTVLEKEPMGYWRPGQLLLYRVEYSLFNDEPFGWHLTGLALHLIAGCMLFFLLTRLTGNRIGAGLAALVFISHPVVTEVVGSNNYQISSIEGALALTALLFWLNKRVTLATVCMAGALMFRESALTLPLLFAFFLLQWPGRFNKQNLAALIAPFSLAALYLLTRFVFLGIEFLTAEESFGFFQRIGLFAFYSAKVIIVPALWALSIVHEPQPTTLIVLAGWGIILASVAFLVFLFWRFRKGATPVALLLFCGFIISALPYSGIIATYILFSEHYLYLPLAFLIGAICALALQSKRKKWIVPGVLFLILLYSAISFSRAGVFADNGTAFSDALSKYPNSVKALMSLGTYHYQKDEINEAVVIYHQVLTLTNGKNEKAWNNMGDIYFRAKMWEKAEECFVKAAKEGQRNLAVLLFIQKRHDELRPLVTELYNRNPGDTVIKEIYDSVVKKE